MDDPWGSPWTSTDRSGELPSSPTHIPSPFESGLSADAPDRLFPLSNQSSWADQEEGFGDWAVADESVAASVSFDFNTARTSIADVNVPESSIHWNDNTILPADEFPKTATPTSNESCEISYTEASRSRDVTELHDERASCAGTTKTHGSEGAGSEESFSSNHEYVKVSGESKYGKEIVVPGETSEVASSKSSGGSNDSQQEAPENAAHVENNQFPLPKRTEKLSEVPKLIPYNGLAQTSERPSPETHILNGSEQIDKRIEHSTPGNEPFATIIGNVAKCPTALAEGDVASEHCFQSALHSLEEYGSMEAIDENRVVNLFGPVLISTLGSQDNPLSPVDGCIPENVISDSFSTISERRMWYRISRQGSPRKYNTDDGNNYRPILWVESKIRSKTVMIVRRWMEEDSFAGNPILGASGARGNLFGWDSVAKPVTLDEVYKRTPSNQPVVLPSSTEHQHPPFDTDKNGILSDSRELSGIRLKFSLATSPEEEQESAQGATHGPISTNKQTRPANALTIVTIGPLSTATTDSDDDDEWGEMVSSPVQKSTFPIPPETVSVADMLHTSHLQETGQTSRTSTMIGRPKKEAGDPPDTMSRGDISQHAFDRKDNSASRKTPASSSPLREKEVLDIEEEFVQGILCSLPNLSYMTR